MSTTPHDGSGTVISFAGTNFTARTISVAFNNPAAEDLIDVSHLGLTAGNSVLTMGRPLTGSATDTGQEVTVEYLGKNLIADQSTGTLVITHNGVQLLSRAATCNSTTLNFNTNEAITGTSTFKIARS